MTFQISPMKFYFSGIASSAEAQMLKEAGVHRLLVDAVDLPNIDWESNPDVALDSGDYQLFKEGRSIIDVPSDKPFSLESYLATAVAYPFSFCVAPDVIGDMQTTLKLWEMVKYTGKSFVLVWQWGAAEEILYQLLDQAPIVGIGGCVPWMRVDASRKRSKEAIAQDKEQREHHFEKLQMICLQYGDRLHVFGLCWVKAIDALKDCLYSADSSHWLVGARKAKVIFQHSRTGHLSEAPAGVLPFAKDWDRKQRCIENARAIMQFLENEPATP